MHLTLHVYHQLAFQTPQGDSDVGAQPLPRRVLKRPTLPWASIVLQLMQQALEKILPTRKMRLLVFSCVETKYELTPWPLFSPVPRLHCVQWATEAAFRTMKVVLSMGRCQVCSTCGDQGCAGYYCPGAPRALGTAAPAALEGWNSSSFNAATWSSHTQEHVDGSGWFIYFSLLKVCYFCLNIFSHLIHIDSLVLRWRWKGWDLIPINAINIDWVGRGSEMELIGIRNCLFGTVILSL